MHKKRTNEQHDKNEESRGPNPEKVEAQRAWAKGWSPEELGPQGLGSEEWGPEGSGPAAWGLEGWGPEGGRAKISLFFSLSRPHFRSFSLSGGLLVGFWAAWVSHDSRRTQTCTTEGPGFHKNHQNSTRRPPEREKMRGGKGKKKAKFCAAPAEGVVQRRGCPVEEKKKIKKI